MCKYLSLPPGVLMTLRRLDLVLYGVLLRSVSRCAICAVTTSKRWRRVSNRMKSDVSRFVLRTTDLPTPDATRGERNYGRSARLDVASHR